MDDSRLTDQKYTELEYLFQTIEMAKSGQDFKNFRDDTAASLSALATTPPTAQLLDLPLQQEDDLNDSSDALNPYAWNLVKRRLRRHRRFTVSHGTTPPAPPSTPTSSSMTLASSLSSTGGNSAADHDSDCFNFNLLYILDYAPKYKKKLKEQQRTDSELAELFNVVTITGSTVDKPSGSHSSRALKSAASSSTSLSTKLATERGISAASRTIRKQDSGIKIFKIHRNPKEFFRDPDEEDSVSAPEYDTEEEDTRFRRFTRISSRRLILNKRQRRYAKYELQNRMDAVVDTFDTAMSFADV